MLRQSLEYALLSRREKGILESENTTLFFRSCIAKDTAIDVAVS